MPLRFAGYAAIFDHPDRGGDIIRPGAFARTLGKRRTDIPLLWQHRRGRVIGQIEMLAEDSRGLRVIARVSDRKAAAQLKTGAGMSFGYRVRASKAGGAGCIWGTVYADRSSNRTGSLRNCPRNTSRNMAIPYTRKAKRELTDLDLVEISLVAIPMQPLARVIAIENPPRLRSKWGGGSAEALA